MLVLHRLDTPLQSRVPHVAISQKRTVRRTAHVLNRRVLTTSDVHGMVRLYLLGVAQDDKSLSDVDLEAGTS